MRREGKERKRLEEEEKEKERDYCFSRDLKGKDGFHQLCPP